MYIRATRKIHRLGYAGVALGGIAVALITLEFHYIVVLATHPSTMMAIAALGAAFGNIVLMYSVAMPAPARLALTVGLILMLLITGARSDVFRLTEVNDAVTASIDHQRLGDMQIASDVGEIPRSSAPQNNIVHLVSRDGRDGSWTNDINVATENAIVGNAEVPFITGTVTHSTEGAINLLTVDWTIGTGVDALPCGTLTLQVTNRAMGLAQVVSTLRRATTSTATKRTLSCY